MQLCAPVVNYARDYARRTDCDKTYARIYARTYARGGLIMREICADICTRVLSHGQHYARCTACDENICAGICTDICAAPYSGFLSVRGDLCGRYLAMRAAAAASNIK